MIGRNFEKLKKTLIFAAVFCISTLTFAQSADKITEILETERLTFGQAAYICVSAVKDVENEDLAYKKMVDDGIISEKYSADDEINLRNFAHFCANTWDVKGSLMLLIFKNARYAFRQMKADGVIRSGADGSKPLTGREALNIVTECLEKYKLKGGAK